MQGACLVLANHKSRQNVRTGPLTESSLPSRGEATALVLLPGVSGNWIEIAYGTSSGAVRVIVQHPETVGSGPQLFQTFTVHRSPVTKIMLSEKHLVSGEQEGEEDEQVLLETVDAPLGGGFWLTLSVSVCQSAQTTTTCGPGR